MEYVSKLSDSYLAKMPNRIDREDEIALPGNALTLTALRALALGNKVRFVEQCAQVKAEDGRTT